MVAVALEKLAVFYSAQKKGAEVREILERSSAIRTRFLAMGISQQATQAFAEKHPDQAAAFYRRGLAVMDPPDPINDDLRGEFTGMIKELDKLLKPAAPSSRRAAPGAAGGARKALTPETPKTPE
jgi:hypothetical protein